MTKRIPDLLFDHYGLVAKDVISPLLDTLVAVRADFGGDLDQFISSCSSACARRSIPRPRASTRTPCAAAR